MLKKFSIITDKCGDADWRQSIRTMIRSPQELLELLELDPNQFDWSALDWKSFALRVPRPFVARMRRSDPADPLLLQILPDAAELRKKVGFGADPLHEQQSNVCPGVIHKYKHRALLLATSTCAVHCRYCFRRHFPYEKNCSGIKQWQPALHYIGEHPEIHEVILSGGDPLLLRDEILCDLLYALARIPHVRRLRIHTRLPIVIPARITAQLLDVLSTNRLHPAVFVIHCNHANEIDTAVRDALHDLIRSGHTVLNQAVLLRRVNDSPEALIELSEALFACGVLPYYLHMPDRVANTSHFYVGERRGRELLGHAAARLPGYLVPRLVREIPGLPAKKILAPLLPGNSANEVMVGAAGIEPATSAV